MTVHLPKALSIISGLPAWGALARDISKASNPLPKHKCIRDNSFLLASGHQYCKFHAPPADILAKLISQQQPSCID